MLEKTLRLSTLSLALVALTLAGNAEAKKKKSAPPPAEDVKLDEDAAASSKQKGSEDSKPAEDAAPAEETPAEDQGEKTEPPPEAPTADTSAATSPVEEKDKTYQFVGARLRGLMIPSFVIGLFGDGGKNVIAPNFGPEFAIRKNNFEYNFSITYTSYVMSHTTFKAPSDPQQAMELVNASLKVLYFAADFVWSHPFNPQWAVTYGGGAGLGVVWGPLYRSQAYPNGSGGWNYCPALAQTENVDPFGGYCAIDSKLGNKPQHVIGYQEPAWTDGGSKPILFPWLAIQTGLRFKPTHAFVARLDLGIGFGQVFLGLGADYGL
jgi:hypothetical protein